jgi:hypothetical protein
MPIVLRPVNPVPMPRIARPGASALMLAIAAAVTGAMRLLGMATSVPSFIVRVCSAASAIVA